MTFTELMSGLSLTTPFFCSLVAGWKAGGLGVLLGLMVGLASSAGGFLDVRILFRWVDRHPKLGSPHPGLYWIGISWLLCIVLAVWIFGFAFLGMWLTERIIHDGAA